LPPLDLRFIGRMSQRVVSAEPLELLAGFESGVAFFIINSLLQVMLFFLIMDTNVCRRLWYRAPMHDDLTSIAENNYQACTIFQDDEIYPVIRVERDEDLLYFFYDGNKRIEYDLVTQRLSQGVSEEEKVERACATLYINKYSHGKILVQQFHVVNLLRTTMMTTLAINTLGILPALMRDVTFGAITSAGLFFTKKDSVDRELNIMRAT